MTARCWILGNSLLMRLPNTSRCTFLGDISAQMHNFPFSSPFLENEFEVSCIYRYLLLLWPTLNYRREYKVVVKFMSSETKPTELESRLFYLSCVTTGKLINFLLPQFLHLKKMDIMLISTQLCSVLFYF